MEKEKKTKICLNVPEELYAEYKKALIDLKTRPTYDLIARMKDIVNIGRVIEMDEVIAKDGDAIRFIFCPAVGHASDKLCVEFPLYTEPDCDEDGNYDLEVDYNYMTYSAETIIEFLMQTKGWWENNSAEIQIIGNHTITIYEYKGNEKKLRFVASTVK